MEINVVVPSIDDVDDGLVGAIRSAGVTGVSLVEPGGKTSWLTIGMFGANGNWDCGSVADLPDMLREVSGVSRLPLMFDDRKVYYDVEVYPNLFVVCWHFEGDGDRVYHVVNPKPVLVSRLLKSKLVGFNNRKYDNHIMWAAAKGETPQQLFERSKLIVEGKSLDGGFPEAYSVGYADVYDYANMGNRKSLKAWEIDLGIKHDEMDIPWDEPVPEHMWGRVVEYCSNDVLATEKVDKHLKADWAARMILCDLAGMPPISSTNQLTARIIFGRLPKYKSPWRYTHLCETFPGYKFEFVKRKTTHKGQPVTYKECVSSYRGVKPSEGGYVYANPGIYHDVALLDVASLHPTSLILMDCFGPYTKRFEELKEGRLFIKRMAAKDEITFADLQEAQSYLKGALVPYLDKGKSMLHDLANALKIAINAVYGQTSARFPNIFNGNKFDRAANPDNIVAKRGALFMIELQKFCEFRGWNVVHIKTDSIKVADSTPEIVQEIVDFGARYGYTFEHEATYDRLCLLDKAQYAAHDADGWHFTGACFLHPYVCKRLFLGEEPVLEDCFERKQVSGNSAMMLGGEHVGRVGRFVPVKDGNELVRVSDGRGLVSGTKDFLWAKASDVDSIDEVDISYHEGLCAMLFDAMSELGDVEGFLCND